jgi:hypothetical protein
MEKNCSQLKENKKTKKNKITVNIISRVNKIFYQKIFRFRSVVK